MSKHFTKLTEWTPWRQSKMAQHAKALCFSSTCRHLLRVRTDGSHELAAAWDSRHSALLRDSFIGGGRMFSHHVHQQRGHYSSVVVSVNTYLTNFRLLVWAQCHTVCVSLNWYLRVCKQLTLHVWAFLNCTFTVLSPWVQVIQAKPHLVPLAS